MAEKMGIIVMKNYRILCCALCFWFFLLPSLVFGRVMYVTDHIEITFRTGPGLENRIIGMLPSGTRLEVRDRQGDWSLVVPLDGPFKNKEGWVLSRYLSNSKPKKVALKEIEEENTVLKSQVEEYKKQVGELKQTVSKLSDELVTTRANLEKIQNDYTLLRTESADFLNLKEKFARLQKELTQLKTTNKKLMEENNKLKSSENLKWFIAGALVLLSGWLIGLVMGRRHKRRPYLY